MSYGGESNIAEDEGEEKYEDLANDYIIFLIDASEAMRPYLLKCFEAALAIYKVKIIASDKTQIGVYLFNTHQSDKDVGQELEHFITLLPLEVPTAQGVHLLKRLSRSLDEFDEKIGHRQDSGDVNLKWALWHLGLCFSNKKSAHKSMDIRRIWLFTNDDSPRMSAEDRLKAAQVVKDAGTDVSIWALPRMNSIPRFDVSAFYKSLMFLQDDEELEDRVSYADDKAGFETLSQLLRKKIFKKRSLATLPLVLGGGLEVGIQVFKTLQTAKKPTPSQLYRPTNELLKTKSRLVDCFGAAIDPATIRTYVEVGSQRAYISSAEAKAIKAREGLVTGALHLLHFAAAGTLNPEMNVQSPYLIYPCEDSIKGSAAVFSALLTSVASKGLIGIAEFFRTKTSASRIVALLPHTDPFTNELRAFHLIPLPYMAEVRKMYTPVAQSAFESTTTATIQCAESVIKALTLRPESWDYTELKNPSIQKYYSSLQAVALTEEEEEWDAAMDELTPDAAAIAACEDLLVDLKTSLGLADMDDDIKKPTKRAREPGEEAPAAKKAHVAAGATDKGAVKAMCDSNQLGQLTIPELKDLCRGLALPVGGKKQDLIDRLESACGSD